MKKPLKKNAGGEASTEEFIARNVSRGTSPKDKAPEVTGMNRVVDFIAQKLNPEWFPTSGRTLLETAQGVKTPITEKNFKPEELDIIRQLIALKGSDNGSITYGDYLALAQKLNKDGPPPTSITPGLYSMGDPLGNVHTTLGRFSYRTDPKGNLQVVDKYDFNPPMLQDMREARTGDYGAFGPYGMIREYAGEKIPPGTGRDVLINLGRIGQKARPVAKFAQGSPNPDEVPSVIDEREEIRSESQRMLNRLDASKQPPQRTGFTKGLRASQLKGYGEDQRGIELLKEFADVPRGVLGATPIIPGGEGYRTGQAVGSGVMPAKVAGMAGDAATGLAALGGAGVGAVRPYGKGTVFAGVKLPGDRRVYSSLDMYLRDGENAAYGSASDMDKIDAIQKFFNTKARRYMTTQLGTEKDPVFNAIKEERISNLALHDKPGLRQYAIEAAREGKFKTDKETGKPVLDQFGRPIFYPKKPDAVVDVTAGYDEMVDIKPVSMKPGLVKQKYNQSDEAFRAEVERVKEQMRQAFEAEGLDPRLMNINEPMILTTTRDKGEPYHSGFMSGIDDFIAAKLSGNPEAMKDVPENVLRALDRNEILYDVSTKGPLREILDPENIAEYLATLNSKEIEKLRFEDAVVRAAKFNEEKLNRKFEGERIKALVESGKASDSIFAKGVSKPLLQFGEDEPHPGFAWKRLEEVDATIPEGAYVGHSVGGYALGGIGYTADYTKGLKDGTHKIYSLRDNRNRPVTTVQVIEEGTPDAPYRVVKQIKGNGAKTGNTAPVEYDKEVYDLLTQVIKPDAIRESDTYLTPLLIQYKDALTANRQRP